MKRIRKCGNRFYVIVLLDRDNRPIPEYAKRIHAEHIECHGCYRSEAEAKRHV